MATQILGKIGMILKGEYSSSVNYAKLDVVNYQGNSYSCKRDGTIGIIPTNTEYWQLLAEKGEKGEKGDKGDTGTTGASGYTPVRGTDYWTATDITTIEQYCANYIDINISQVIGGAY